jgi:hypothetical protein
MPRPKPSTIEKRQARAVEALARWQRKLKLARTKVRKLSRTVAYYQKRQAAAKAPRAPRLTVEQFAELAQDTTYGADFAQVEIVTE